MAEERKLTDLEQVWRDLATLTMEEGADTIAVVTMIIDRRGIIKPMVRTKGLPDHVGMTFHALGTELMCQLCQPIFNKAFRCGCSTCESDAGKAMREAMKRAPWSTIKAEA